MPRPARHFKLIPADVPPRRSRSGGIYDEVVADFLASGVASALVEIPGRKPQTVGLGLRKAVLAAGAGVSVVSRADQVYLRRG